jgi:TatD DNase family protein
VRLIDTHVHLDSPRFDGDREAVLDRARQAGVGVVVNVGANLRTSRQAVDLADRHPMVYAAVGMHPHDAKELNGTALAELRQLAKHPKVVAVGEIGLDFYRDLSPRNVQRRAFKAQLAWAAKLGKPVIIHDRDAHDEILDTLTGWAAGLGNSPLAGRLGVLHTFSGDVAMATQAVELGFYISISGPVTYKKPGHLPEVVVAVPLDRLLVETDCPYLSPQSYRGKRNEPAYVRLVAERVAEFRGMPLEDLAQATTVNAERLFRFAASSSNSR